MSKQKASRFSIVQMFILAFLLCVLPLYAFFLVFIDISYRSNRESVLQISLIECQSIVEQIDRNIQSIQVRQFELLQDEIAIPLTYPQNSAQSMYQWVSNISHLLSTLKSVYSLNDYIDAMSLYYPERGIVLTQDAASSYKRIEDMETLHWLQALYQNAKGMFVAQGDIYLVTASNARAPTAFDPELTLPQILVVTRISKNTLRQDLIRHATQDAAKDFLLTGDNFSEVVASTFTAEDAVTMLSALQEAAELEEEGAVEAGGERYAVMSARSEVTGWVLYEVVRESTAFARILSLQGFIPVITVLVACIILFFALLLYRKLHMPVRRLSRALVHVQAGDFSTSLQGAGSKDLEAVFQDFNAMAADLKSHIDKEYTQQLLLKDAELKQLQLQISPHFLYNAFFILQSLLEEEEYDHAQHMTFLLGTYLQYITKNKNLFAALAQEDRHARAYAQIQQIRFIRTLHIDIAPFPEDWGDLEVPRLILQPLIENAFSYGIAKQQEGSIRVRYQESESGLDIRVEDSGGGDQTSNLQRIEAILSNTSSDNTGIAIGNIHTRLRLAFGSQSGLFVEPSPLGGICMVIHIERSLHDSHPDR